MSVQMNTTAEVRDANDIRVVTPQFRPEFAAIIMVRGDDCGDYVAIHLSFDAVRRLRDELTTIVASGLAA